MANIGGFPIHSFGVQEFAQAFLPALQRSREEKQELSQEQINTTLENIKTAREAGQKFTPTQQETLRQRGGEPLLRQQQAISEQKKEEMQDNVFSRKIKQYDAVGKSVDTTIKLMNTKGISPDTLNNMIAFNNKAAKEFLGVDLGLNIGDTPQTAKEKWVSAGWENVNRITEQFNTNPTVKSHNRLMIALDKFENTTGESTEAVKMAANATLAEQRKQTAKQTLAPKVVGGQVISGTAERPVARQIAGFGREGKEFAPDVKTFFNPATGEDRPVNTRSQAELNKATKEGFSPINPEERGFLEEQGKLAAKGLDQIIKDSNKARSQIQTLSTLDNLLDRFETGKLAKVGKAAQQWASAFGIDVDVSNLSAKEAFTAITEQLALQSRNMGEGMVLAGQMSDRDVQFLRDMNPQLVISKAGNKLIINIRKKVAERNSQIATLAREFRKQSKGRFDRLDFDAFVAERLGGTSLFGVPEGASLAGTDSQTGLPVYRTSAGQLIMPEF